MRLCSLPDYNITEKRRYDSFGLIAGRNIPQYEKLIVMAQMLMEDKYYHFKFEPDRLYNLTIDLDHFKHDIRDFISKLKFFMNKCFVFGLGRDPEVFVTKSIGYDAGGESYHINVPKVVMSSQKQKKFVDKFHEFLGMGYKVMDYNTYTKNRYFRAPLQSKGLKQNIVGKGIHRPYDIHKQEVIEPTRDMEWAAFSEDNLVNYVPYYIDEHDVYIYLDEELDPEYESEEKYENKKKDNTVVKDKNNVNMRVRNEYATETYDKLKEMLEKKDMAVMNKILLYVLNPARSDSYDDWTKIGMVLKNTYGNKGHELWDKFSQLSSDKYSKNECIQKWESFNDDKDEKVTLGTIMKWAKEDNEKLSIMYMRRLITNLGSLDDLSLAGYVTSIRPYIYWDPKVKVYIVWNFEKKKWETNSDGSAVEIIKTFISTTFADVLEDVIYQNYGLHMKKKNVEKFGSMIDAMIQNKGTELILNRIKETSSKVIEFDTNQTLIGFNNGVIDLKSGEFRDKAPEDYVLKTTGYDYIKPSKEAVDELNEFFVKVFPDKKEREFVLEMCSTCLVGKPVEKFFILEGSGRNGKSSLTDLLLGTVGNEYGLSSTSGVLQDSPTVGANPQLASIDNKRVVVFREIDPNKKIVCATYKSMTGGGTISARNCFQNTTVKILSGTFILECNTRPQFNEALTEADYGRIVDVPFRSLFNDNIKGVNNETVFLASEKVKTYSTNAAIKSAFIDMLIPKAVKKLQNWACYELPDSIGLRTANYFETSSEILSWLMSKYEPTNNKKDVLNTKDMFSRYGDTQIIGYAERKTKTLTWFREFLRTDRHTRNNYVVDKIRIDKEIYQNALVGWRLKDDPDE